nr:hypothetical protein Itr_chr15CG11090 [Ipomoea trifida]
MRRMINLVVGEEQKGEHERRIEIFYRGRSLKAGDEAAKPASTASNMDDDDVN